MNYPDRSGWYDLPLSKVTLKTKTYSVAGSFIYHGSDKIGSPKQVRIICGIVDSNAVLDIRIYDVTHNVVICEQTGLTSNYPSIQDLGTISNLSEEEAVWEIQIRHSGNGNREVAVAGLVVRY